MSSEATTEDELSEQWLELDDNLSVPTQTLDEILAERDNGFDEDFSAFEEEDSFARLGTSLVTSSSVLPMTYQLDCPITLNKLDSISHQMRSVHDKDVGGKPTALAVCQNLIAVGTTRGLAMLFDRKTERLLQFVRDNNDKCPVSALKFSPNGSKIAVAFSRGALRIYKTSNGKLVDERLEIVQPGHGILHVVYISNSAMLLVDSGGSVYEYREGRSSGARCIFTGCKGEAVNVSFMDSEKLILLSTLKQVLVFSAMKIGVLTQLRLNGPPNAPPLIDTFIQTVKITARANATDSRFCLARGNEIRIHQTQTNARKVLICPLVRVIQLPADMLVCNICWLNEHHLLLMDSKENLTLVDVHRGNMIESLNINQVQLVYGSADFKGLSTGGNVSEALRFMAENVCYQSICHLDGTVYLLGQRGIFKVKIMDQFTQLELFEQRNEIASAILYSIDIYYGRIHDKTKQKTLRAELSARLPNLILKLLDLTMDGLASGKVADLVDHYKRHIYVLIRSCVISSHFDLLYNTVYRRLEADPLAKQVFLELLDEFVVDSQLFDPPPTLINDYLAYLIGEGQFSLFETAVTHIPISSLDLNSVMITCRQNQLFDGLIYVMNNAFIDYIGPLEEMCECMAKFTDKSVFSDSEIALGNKVLLYLSSCLAGRAFPYGQLPSELVDIVPLETYKFMISIKSKNSTSDREERFPNLRLFLRFDAQQFLNLICTIADAPLFTNQNSGRLKRFVDCLVALSDEIPDLSTLLLSFISHLLAKNAIPQDNDLIETLILRVLDQFTNDTQRPSAQMQNSVIELIKVVPSVPRDAILAKAKTRPYILICSYILTSRKQYIDLLLCCMQVQNNSATVFKIIRELLTSTDGHTLEEIRLFIQNSMGRLNMLDSLKTAELFLEYFVEFIATAKTLPFDMLLNCFSIKQQQGMHTLCGDEEADELLFHSLFEAIINRGHADPREFRPRMSADELDLILVDYLDYWLPIGSHDDGCLNAAVKANLIECSVLLLVARRHDKRAFKTLFDALEKTADNPDLTARRIQLFFKLLSKCQLEARASGWPLKLFHFMLSAKDKNHQIENFDEISVNLLAAIVESGARSEQEIESFVEALFAHKSLCDVPTTFLSLIKRLLLSCQMEELMMRSAVECERIENLETLQQLVNSSKSSLVETNACVYCQEALNQSFLVFSCSHLAHFECSEHYNRQCLCAKNPTIRVRNVQVKCESPRKVDPHRMYDDESMKLRPQGWKVRQESPMNPFFD